MAISKADYQRLADERNALRDELARLRAVKPQVIEKPVTVIKERIVEKPVEVIKERRVEIPVKVVKTRTIEKPVEVIKVEYRDNETALVKKLQAKVATLLAENAALKAGAK